MQPRPKQGVSLQLWAHLHPICEKVYWLWGPSGAQRAGPTKPTAANSKAPKGCKPEPCAPALLAGVVGWCLPPLALLMQPPSLCTSVSCFFLATQESKSKEFKSYSAGRPWCRKEGCWALRGGMAHLCSQQVLPPMCQAHLLHCCSNSFLLMVSSSTPAHRVKQFMLANGDAHNPCTKQQRYSASSLPILLSNAPSLSKLLIRDY